MIRYGKRVPGRGKSIFNVSVPPVRGMAEHQKVSSVITGTLTFILSILRSKKYLTEEVKQADGSF